MDLEDLKQEKHDRILTKEKSYLVLAQVSFLLQTKTLYDG